MGSEVRKDLEEMRRSQPSSASSLAAQVAAAGGNADVLAELMREAREDDNAERDAHQKLLSRIDELCGQLSKVEQAAGNAGTEFAQQFEQAVEKVEHRFVGLQHLQQVEDE